MMSTKNLVKLANKWRRIAAASRKRISFPRSNNTKSSTTTEKGQFIVYTIDEKRFALPLAYLESQVSVAAEMEEALILSLSDFCCSTSSSAENGTSASLEKKLILD
ncbi:hypothetical protein V2J09_020748 [Rumex salicifolius]